MSEQRLFGGLKQELFLVLPHYTWSWQFGLCSPEWLFLWAHTCICVSCLSSSQLFVLGLAYCDWRDRLDWVVCLSLPSQLAWAFLHDGNSFQEWRSGNSCGQGSDWHYIISATFFWSKEITWPAHIQGLRKWSPPLMEVAAKYCGHFFVTFHSSLLKQGWWEELRSEWGWWHGTYKRHIRDRIWQMIQCGWWGTDVFTWKLRPQLLWELNFY